MIDNLTDKENNFYLLYKKAYKAESLELYKEVIVVLEEDKDPSAFTSFLLSLSYYECFDIHDLDNISSGQRELMSKALKHVLRAKKSDKSLGLVYAQHASIIGRKLTFLQKPFLPIIGTRMNNLIEKSFRYQGEHEFCYLQRGIGNYFTPPFFGGGAENALLDLEKALKLSPDNPEVLAWMGLCYSQLKIYTKAIECLEQSIALKDRNRFAEIELTKLKNKLNAKKVKV